VIPIIYTTTYTTYRMGDASSISLFWIYEEKSFSVDFPLKMRQRPSLNQLQQFCLNPPQFSQKRSSPITAELRNSRRRMRQLPTHNCLLWETNATTIDVLKQTQNWYIRAREWMDSLECLDFLHPWNNKVKFDPHVWSCDYEEFLHLIHFNLKRSSQMTGFNWTVNWHTIM